MDVFIRKIIDGELGGFTFHIALLATFCHILILIKNNRIDHYNLGGIFAKEGF